MPPLPLRLPARLRLAPALALGAALALASPSAAAQTSDDLTHARQVFNEAKQHEAKGEWAEALENLKQVATVKMTPQVRFHIALCEENLGRLVSAIKGYDLATEEAQLAGAAAIEVFTNAPVRAATLRGRVAKLTLDVKGQVVTSKITLDGRALGPKELGAEILVDPGDHTIEVRDDAGNSTFHRSLTLSQKGASTVEVPVDDHEATAPPLVTGSGAGTTQAPSRAPVYITATVALAALAASGVFWILRANTIAEIRDQCANPAQGTGCPPTDMSLENQGHLDTTLAGVFLGVGLAGLATAGALLIVSAVKKKPADPQKASVQLVPTGKGFQLVGTF
jgi:hypothetical protein